jgi:D,D-heptose 1,7-bisphosphate phosphatase
MTRNSTRGAAVFLDRDGTLIRDVGYLRRADQIEILPGVPAALRLLHDHGFKLVVVTNQSAVARGWVSEQDVDRINQTLVAELGAQGARLDAIYYCPHHPVEGKGVYKQVCSCRKPNTGMIERACMELGLNPCDSYVVGDQEHDIELAGRVGATGLLIRASGAPVTGGATVACALDLHAAALWIVERSRRSAQNKESA